ncbi:MAG TPA: CDGSH iron-sulfur domain-containing protein [Lacisediminihabitans sp.]|nr:CDGSH iron-sulfur domain-containing protein [Lacisediminihabitans sp.]HXD62849.1 CDGSH iron-sulfur domain-containing protein [Lacisediminihabitans sp.]
MTNSNSHLRPVQIVACPNGPLLVRGSAELVTPEGETVERRRATVALCRCGVSSIKPYCDGTHKSIGFRTETPATDQRE